MDWNNIIEDFNNGESIVKLSKKYNISYSKIDSYLILNGFKKINHKISEEKYEKIVYLISNGKSISEISKQEEVGKRVINYIAYENNLVIQKRK